MNLRQGRFPLGASAATGLLSLALGVMGGCGRQTASSMPSGPWNSKAIQATFDGIMLDENNHLLTYYVLKNDTGADYQMTDGSKVAVMMKLRGEKETLQELSDRDVRVLCPISIPARRRYILTLRRLRLTYPSKYPLRLHAAEDEIKQYRAKLEAFVESRTPGFDGYVLFDKATGYKIDLPKGW